LKHIIHFNNFFRKRVIFSLKKHFFKSGNKEGGRGILILFFAYLISPSPPAVPQKKPLLKALPVLAFHISGSLDFTRFLAFLEALIIKGFERVATCVLLIIIYI
jgi:hypothetical protein